MIQISMSRLRLAAFLRHHPFITAYFLATATTWLVFLGLVR